MRKTVSGMMLTLLLTSMLTLAFNIQPVKSDWTWTENIYISADGSVDPSDAPISSADNITYTLTDNIVGNVPASSSAVIVERDNIVVDGAGYTVQGTRASGSRGIDLTGRKNITIRNMEIRVFYYGIYLYSSSNYNSISGNNITANKGCGIWLYSSSSNSISGNNIANNGDGIRLYSSSNYNSISGNNITANNLYGILLSYSSNYNCISGNNIANNLYGIYLWYFSNYNSVFYNNFVNNAQQVYPSDSVNTWDDGYPSGGNYWSDYRGVDIYSGPNQDQPENDRIGDTPYVIDAKNLDRYPLMYPWGSPGPPGYYETSEYLIGSVVVATIFLESNGTIDPSTENWNLTEIGNANISISQALNWWGSQNPNASVSFIRDADPLVGVVQSYIVVNTSYEPINCNSTDEGLWIGEAMTQLGYPGTDYVRQTYAYLNDLRNQERVLRYNWAFVIFMVDSSNDADDAPGCFADGFFAYAPLGGPFIVMTYTNNGWEPDDLNRTAAHEIGHIFYATDEWDDISEYSGYLNVQDYEDSGGIMDDDPVEGPGDPWLGPGWRVTSGTWGQVGWRDSDSDGIQDIVDMFPVTVLNPYSPDPTNKPTLTYTGTVTEIPYPNNNPYGTGRDVTINTIFGVEYRVDGGTWQSAASEDGAFDEYEENFSFTTPSISVGTHIIETRGINSISNIETSYASDGVTRAWALVYVPQDYSIIQLAVNAAYPRDTILIATGTYYESVVVNKTLSLIGENRESTIIDGNWAENVVEVTADNVNITGFTIQKGGWRGVAVTSSGNNISYNIIADNSGIGGGVELGSSSFNTISGNIITNSWWGIAVYGSSNNTISDNTITNNGAEGWFSGGVFLDRSANNTVSGNSITNNRAFGIADEAYGPSSNIIYGNTVTNHSYGIRLYYSSGDRIYHNNVVDNSEQVNIVGSYAIWDDGYPSGGNYWSDYAGVDLYSGVYQNVTGNDGIGDIPYVIDENNKDTYPLMGPFGPLTSKGENVTVFPVDDVSLTFENVTAEGSTTVNKTEVGPEPPSGFKLAENYYDIKTTANYSGKITVRIIYDDSNMTQQEEETLQLMQYDETLQQWTNITTHIDTENNIIYGETTHLSIFAIMSPSQPPPDIAVTNVTLSKTVVGQGFNVSIGVTVENQGNAAETFNVTIYANTTVIATLTNTTLTSGKSTIIAFTWNTTGFAKGNYTIKAVADTILGEIDIEDNNFTGWIIIAMVGDVDANGKVDMLDLWEEARHFGIDYPDPRYKPNFDIDDNLKIDMLDLWITAREFGKIDP